jgi:hypothetical protein
MSQPEVPAPTHEPVDRVKLIKQLLAQKAALDIHIDNEVRHLTPEERQKLYLHHEYFPKKGYTQ